MPEFSTLVARSYLAATVTYNNTAALANTALSVTVEAGEKYTIELVIHSDNVTRALNLDFGGTATITNFIGEWHAIRENDPTTGATTVAMRVTAAGTDFSLSSQLDAVAAFITFRGSVEVNAAGTFLLRGAQAVAHASNTTILRGSTLILTKIS